MTRPKHLVPFQREILATPDGDDLIVDHLAGVNGNGASAGRPRPHLILLHGLEGSSYSVYMQGMLSLAAARGWRGTAVNFRSCARDPQNILRMLPNKRPRMYHSGETADFDFVARTIAARDPEAPLLAVAVSLGGNALLKWLGEHPGQALVKAAATMSVPYDLAAGSKHLETFLGRYYLENFLKTLRPKAISAAERFGEDVTRIDIERTRASQTFWEFDDAATGPLHGFKDALDYYTRSSSLGFVDKITTPTLCVSAADDPFLPPPVLPQVKDRKAPCVELMVTPRGGHVGFITGPHPWKPRFWAEDLVISWLAGKI
jgi:predicted alpha/beta-fold hydrolase